MKTAREARMRAKEIREESPLVIYDFYDRCWGVLSEQHPYPHVLKHFLLLFNPDVPADEMEEDVQKLAQEDETVFLLISLPTARNSDTVAREQGA